MDSMCRCGSPWGCCFIDEVAAPYDEMLEKADIAMYQNKRQRKEKHGKQPRRKE